MKGTETEGLREFRDRLRDLENDAPPVMPSQEVHSRRRAFNPRRLLAGTFLVLILFGGFLLNTPWAQASGRWSWEIAGQVFSWARFGRAVLDNLFMATSASCVTGLTVVDVSSYYTTFGHVVLMGCIQLGGLSLMTLGTIIVTILLGRVPAGGEQQVMLSYGVGSSGRARSLLRQTMKYVFCFELSGALLLFLRYHWYHGYAIGKSAWFAAFHAVSAFCNAGFSLHSESLVALRGDVPYLVVVTLLVTLGGIGFLVLANVFQYRFWRRDLRVRGRITLHSRLVLWTSLILFVVGGLLFTALEWNGSLGVNPGPSLWESLLHGDWKAFGDALILGVQKVCDGVSQAAMFRTAGFNVVPIGEVSPPANLLSVLLMLIGGSPGSIAGGIKTTTLVVLLLTIRAYILGNPDVQIHRRTISGAICREAMVIVFFYLTLVFLFYFVLLLTERALIAARGDFALFYEVTSAFGTVGTSLNATTLLSPYGRVLISLAMFLGRIGPISLALMMAGREVSRRIRYPEETITVG